MWWGDMRVLTTWRAEEYDPGRINNAGQVEGRVEMKGNA
jgi:hypothetical protein